jgi:hypothetical protein
VIRRIDVMSEAINDGLSRLIKAALRGFVVVIGVFVVVDVTVGVGENYSILMYNSFYLFC